MCGRFSLTASPEDVAALFELGEIDDFPPRYNIAPTQPVMMIANQASGKIGASLVRWGLVPSWVKDPGDFTLLINARSETAAEKPSFRSAMRHRRTLIPASGFYEWHRPDDKSLPKQAYWIRPKAREDGTPGIVCFGGLMETWSGANGSEIDSGCILTTSANDQIGKIHDRMPVVIKPEDFERWLDCRNYEPRDMIDLMHPIENGYFEAIPVGDKVNKVANSGADVQEPMDPMIGHNRRPEKTLSKKSAGKKSADNDSSAQFKLF